MDILKCYNMQYFIFLIAIDQHVLPRELKIRLY